MYILAHPYSLRRKRRGIEPQGIKVAQSSNWYPHNSINSYKCTTVPGMLVLAWARQARSQVEHPLYGLVQLV